jgi:ubiquinone/menaquinone biosynthesis C-methylase UbiE
MLTEQKKTMQSVYDGVARVYVKRDEGVRRLFHNSIEFGWLDDLPLTGKRLLDVGAGVGRLSRYVGDQAGLIIGVDISSEMLRIARKRLNDLSHSWFTQCDAEFLPFVGDTFDFVACFGLFEYVANLEPYLREFYRVTVPGGHLLFTCHNRAGLVQLQNRAYPRVHHTVDAVQGALRSCGYCLVRHATVYHLNGRWIWALGRMLRPFGGEVGAIRSVVSLNRMFETSVRFHNRGKVHLVLAQRP